MKVIKKHLPDVPDKFSWMLVQNFNNDIKVIQEERDGKLTIKHDNSTGKGQYSMPNREHNEQYRINIKHDLEVPHEIGLIQNKLQIIRGSSFYIMMLNRIVTSSVSSRLIDFPKLTKTYFKPSYGWSQGIFFFLYMILSFGNSGIFLGYFELRLYFQDIYEISRFFLDFQDPTICEYEIRCFLLDI